MEKYIQSEQHGEDYFVFRPSPPVNLFSKIVDFLLEEVQDPPELAVDIGCGSGQSTIALSNFFKTVRGIDPDPVQISYAQQRNDKGSARFSVGGAESLDCSDESVSLVLAVQSAHWFRMESFYEECQRVLIPGGVLALSGYSLPKVFSKTGKDMSQTVLKLFSETLGPYVKEGSHTVYIENYTKEPFIQAPFAKEPFIRETFKTSPKPSKLQDLVGYLKTWTTYQNYVEQEGLEKAECLMRNFVNDFSKALGPEDKNHTTDEILISFEYFLLLCRKPMN